MQLSPQNLAKVPRRSGDRRRVVARTGEDNGTLLHWTQRHGTFKRGAQAGVWRKCGSGDGTLGVAEVSLHRGIYNSISGGRWWNDTEGDSLPESVKDKPGL